jgi:hypothetical protein
MRQAPLGGKIAPHLIGAARDIGCHDQIGILAVVKLNFRQLLRGPALIRPLQFDQQLKQQPLGLQIGRGGPIDEVEEYPSLRDEALSLLKR